MSQLVKYISTGTRLLALWVLFVLPAMALAEVQEFIANGRVPIYSEPSTKSEVMIELERGDRVPISNRTFGSFKRVLIRIDGEKKIGYLSLKYLKETSLAEGSERNASHVFHRRVGVGLYLGLSYLSQDAREIKDQSGGSPIKVSKLSGSTTYLGLSLDIPVASQFSLKLIGNLRRANLTGTTQITSNNTQTVRLNQDMIGGGAFGKFYFSKNGDFWMGGGFEVAKATNVSLVYADNTNVPISQTDYPVYFFTQAAMGMDFNVSGNFYLLPEIRAGAAANAQPIITSLEIILGASYGF